MGLVYSSEVQFIIMVGHGVTQAGTVLEKELRVLHLDPKATGRALN